MKRKRNPSPKRNMKSSSLVDWDKWESCIDWDHWESMAHIGSSLRRNIASKVKKPDDSNGFRFLVSHKRSVTAVVLSEDDSKGFSASKDGAILKWNVEDGESERYLWPPELKISYPNMLDVAVSTDGRHLATGGLDCQVHLWDTRTCKHVRAFSGHKGPISCLSFRQGSSELISGSYDGTLKLWNVDHTSPGRTITKHGATILTTDCSQYHGLSVGRDRTMRLWNVPGFPERVFKGPEFLECCRLINNIEFLSGSSDGSVMLWNTSKNYPNFIFENAHSAYSPNYEVNAKGNGHLKSDRQYSSAQSWVGAVAVCRNSDLAASGAANGIVRLWKIKSNSKLEPSFSLPLDGFVNSLAFAKSGRFLVAGVGREPRLGRWDCLPRLDNGVLIKSLGLDKDVPFKFHGRIYSRIETGDPSEESWS